MSYKDTIKDSEYFTCEACENTYEKAWSDKEAILESKEIFGERPAQEMSIICDDCFKKAYKQFVFGRYFSKWLDTEKGREYQNIIYEELLKKLR